MDTVDHEGHPMHLVGRAVVYWPWLLWAIIKANIDVALRILSPRLPISPTMVEVQTSQKSALGQVIYANSITLTPGTVSVDLTDGMIIVHALSRESAEALMDGEMDRRVTVMEGAS
jgi:multicomponent Na+:H+ antiporter subunit E